MRAILQEDPSESAVQKLFSLMDKDGNGTVELNEFVDVMADWMGGDDWEKRRKANHGTLAEERIGVHQQIKAFFSQFNEADNFSAVRQKLKERVFAQSLTMDQMEDNDTIMTGMDGDSDDETKLKALNFANDCVLNFGSVMAGLNSNNPMQQLEATKNVCDLLSLVVLFNSPLERRTITTVLVKIYGLLYDGGVMNKVMSFLAQNQQPPLQFQALKALTLYVPGPRIASTPHDHDLHPDKMFFKRHVKNANVIPTVYQLLDHSLADIREQAVACLGAFASQHPLARDYLLKNNGLMPLLKFANPNSSLPMLRRVSFVLACMVGYTHPPGYQPDFGLIKPALPALAHLCYSNDMGVLRNTLAAMALVLPSVPEPNILSRVVDILSWHDEAKSEAVIAALHVLCEVIKMDHAQTKLLVEQNVVTRLRNLLKHKNDHVRMNVVETLIILAKKGSAQALFEGKVIPVVLELLSTDSYVRLKVAKFFRSITHGTPQQVSYLVNSCDIIKRLSDSLNHFKEYDSVLSKIYKYMGPSYNFAFVHDLITSLHNVVNVGFMVSEQTGDNNQYALRFSMGDIDQIKNLLNLITTNSEEELAWRKTAESDSEFSSRRVEELIASLLYKIKKANDRSTSTTSRVIAKEITNIWERFFGKSSSQTSSESNIFFKCVMQGVASGDDIRIIEAPKSIKFATLLDNLQLKYHRQLVLKFKDQDGDQVVLDSDGALHRALTFARNNTVVLYLHDEGDLMSARADPLVSNLELSPVNSPMIGSKKRRAFKDMEKGSSINTSAKIDFENAPKKNFASASTPPPVHHQVPSSPTTRNWMTGIEQLQQADRGKHLEAVRNEVNLTQAQVAKLKQTYEKLADGEGHINRYKFAEGLRSIGINNDLLIEQNWNAFDEDRDGSVSVQEFVTAIGIMCNGSMKDKLRFVFNMYDADGNGTLDKDEVLQIFKVRLLSFLLLSYNCFQGVCVVERRVCPSSAAQESGRIHVQGNRHQRRWTTRLSGV